MVVLRMRSKKNTQYNPIVLLAFVVLDLVSSVLRQEIGWEERLRNNLLCVEWDVKP